MPPLAWTSAAFYLYIMHIMHFYRIFLFSNSLTADLYGFKIDGNSIVNLRSGDKDSHSYTYSPEN